MEKKSEEKLKEENLSWNIQYKCQYMYSRAFLEGGMGNRRQTEWKR